MGKNQKDSHSKLLSSFFSKTKCSFFSKPDLLYREPTFGMALRPTRMIVFPVTFVMWTENKLFSRKGITWKQNDNLIAQYEHE